MALPGFLSSFFQRIPGWVRPLVHRLCYSKEQLQAGIVKADKAGSFRSLVNKEAGGLISVKFEVHLHMHASFGYILQNKIPLLMRLFETSGKN